MTPLLIAPNISMQMGGEASQGWYYFTLMRERGIDVQVATHARCRDELRAGLPAEELERFHFVEDHPFERLVHRASLHVPERVRDHLFIQTLQVVTMLRIRRMVKRRLIPPPPEGRGVDVIFEPAPITPKGLSYMHRLGVPVVIGPLSGGMDFPPGFRFMDSRGTRAVVGAGKAASRVLQRLVPGKREADVLLVANDATAAALPAGCKGRVIHLPEVAVDLRVWGMPDADDEPPAEHDGPVRFVFMGRFIELKGIGYLIEAFGRLDPSLDARLELVGGGELDDRLRQQVRDAGLEDRVTFHGYLPREQAAKVVGGGDVFVLPSLRECGGIVLLEAMAQRKPIICTDWAGPGRYVNEEVGIKVAPDSPAAFVEGLRAAMERMIREPALRQRLGHAGPARTRSNHFDWQSKTDRVLEILEGAIGRFPSRS